MYLVVALMERTLEEWVSLPYAVEILVEQLVDESWMYVDLHPELPVCMGQGRTPEAATADLSSARRDWIAFTLDDGREVPLPAVLASTETV